MIMTHIFMIGRYAFINSKNTEAAFGWLYPIEAALEWFYCTEAAFGWLYLKNKL
mgnify:CR=1 FL=1